MNEISTQIKTHVVITYNDSHYFITMGQNNALKNLGTNDRIEIEGNSIKGSNISEVMTIEKYYETYPKKIAYGQPTSNYDFKDFRSETLSRNGLASMIKGLKKAVAEFRAEGKEPLKALELLTKAEKRYQEKYGENSLAT